MSPGTSSGRGTRRSLAAALALVALAAMPGRVRAALPLVQRFGPDGLPFTHDDPLAPGGGAAGARFAAMAADACSENRHYAAHQHNASHPPEGEVHTENLTPATNHVARPTPADMIAGAPGENLVLEAPFDWIVSVLGVNLADGTMTRHRAFPTDDHWTDPATERPHPDRGWVVPGWTPAERDMDKVYAGGPIKDLHLDALGLAYRDIGARGPDEAGGPGDGWTFGIHWETFDHFESDLKERFDPRLGARLDFLAQQSFVQGWVAELVDLNSFENGVSGNFVADVAGMNPVGTMAFDSDPTMGCHLEVRDLPVELGAVAGRFPADIGFEALMVDLPRPEYGNRAQFDYVLDEGKLEGAFWCADGMKYLKAEEKRQELREKMRELDALIELVFPDDAAYETIGLYSGVAGRSAKSPSDKLALAQLEEGGQFKPTQWLRWRYLGADPVASLGFDEGENGQAVRDLLDPVVTESTSKVMTEEEGWRYNSGNTFLAKSMLLFGGSEAERRTPLGEPVPAEDATRTPDILESFAKQWLFVRMDMVDPLLADEAAHVAVWQERDALIAHPEARAGKVLVDWPPPNFHFGRGQVSSFRSGSGGQLGGQERHAPVDPFTTVQFQGLVCVDPVSATVSVAGVGLGEDGEGSIEFRPPSRQVPGARDVPLLSWTTPQPLSQLPAWLENGSGLRWLSAVVNHHGEGGAVVRWMWDFDRDGAVDSEHAQQMADVGTSTTAAVFAYQPSTRVGETGRTGFTFLEIDPVSGRRTP